MEGPRPPAERELSEVIRFLNTHLSEKRDWSIDSEYPTALNLGNLNNIRIIKENGSVCSHAVLKIHLIKSPVGIFKVGAIGNVVTDKMYRNKGYSTKIVEQCIQVASDQGCDFSILWTNLLDTMR